ncbi:hypothetical protein J4471_04770 [Candidatus Woesearchaeota archaeon]|nr:hypothetical protein [Candidatus Woesearchaeota archaeon]
MARVKGFLFTVGFMIFCAALLTLIVIIFSTTYQEDKRFSEIVALDRLQTLDNSIQHSIKEAFTSYAGINVTFRKEDNPDFTDVMFNETIPNNVDAFNFNLDYIKLLVESEYNYTFLNVSHIKETLPLLVEPYNILYTHNFANNQIQIIPEDASPTSMLKGYRFVVTNLISTECQVQNIYVNGIFIVEIEASESDPFGNPNCIKNFVIDPDKNNKFSIGIPPDLFTIEISNGGGVTITNDQGGSPKVASILYLDPNIDYNKTKVVLPGSVIRISDPYLKVYRKDSIRIL